MLLAKLNQTAKFPKQSGPFSNEVIEATHMTAMARPYLVGGKNTSFEVAFGNIGKKTNYVEVVGEDGQKQLVEKEVDIFQQVGSHHIELTQDDLANWTSNDEEVLHVIASKFGVSCVEFTTL